MKNRLVIYFFYDGQGIVDDYNLVLLRDMMKNCKDLLVVSNGQLSEEGRKKFSQITDQILERENKGFDVGAYKEALLTLGWEKLAEYDEVILMNYTIMGPVYPFSEMFEAMDAREELDFWGITKHHMVPFDPYGIIKCGYIREHIQSHFIAVRKAMLTSEAYHEYWENMPKIKSYGESVAYHESYFTHHFEKKGFKWDVYVNTDDMKKITEYPLLKRPKQLMEEKRCPIFKRRNFFHNYPDFINSTIGEPSYELMEYLKHHTEYDVNLIWDNILRCCNQALIKQCLHLNYVMPSDFSKDITDILKKRKIALVMHLFFEDLVDESFRYACSMPAETDVFITVGSEKMEALVKEKFSELPCHQCTVLRTPNRGRDVGSVLVAVNPQILEYDYVCFAHDKKVTQLAPQSIGSSWAYECFESVLKSKDYVRNVIATFEENPRLGLLTPMPPNHANYFPTMGREWAANFKKTKKLARELGIQVPMDKEYPPISALGCFFWYRPKAMKKLYDRNWKFEDFPEEPVKATDGTIMHAIERLYAYAVQDAGYYPAWCFSDNIAAIEISNLNYMLRTLNLDLMKAGMEGTFVVVEDSLSRSATALKSMRNLHAELAGMFGMEISSGYGISGLMRLYYDTGDGFNEEECEKTNVFNHKNKFNVEFEIPEAVDEIEHLRFDPGENGDIILKKLEVEIEYADGVTETVDLSVCDSNGIAWGETILFPTRDPQIYIPCHPGKKIRSISVSGKVQASIDPDTLNAALNQHVVKLEPKLYFDRGNGIREEDSLQVINSGSRGNLKAVYHFHDSGISVQKFRFDPAEKGMFLLKSFEAYVEYEDGSKEDIALKECETNGIMLTDAVLFLTEDPQIIWKTKMKAACRKVVVTGQIEEQPNQKSLLPLYGKKERIISLLKNHS